MIDAICIYTSILFIMATTVLLPELHGAFSRNVRQKVGMLEFFVAIFAITWLVTGLLIYTY